MLKRKTKIDEITSLDMPKKKTKKINFPLYLIWAFMVPAALFLGMYVLRGVYPLSGASVLVLDLNAQYVYFFEELRDILLGNGSLLYSWERAMGGEFLGMFAYYVASPFNFIIALFPEKFITEALLFIFVLKAGLSGFNFAVYLHYSGKSKIKTVTVIFATMYALTSYAIVYGHNTMWIDALLFLPLIILGLEKLISSRKYILYTVILTVTIIANFYIGYMVCLFVILYFFYYYFSHEKAKENFENEEKLHFIKSGLRVLFFSVLAIMMSAVILLGIYYSLKFGKNDFSDPSYALNSKFNYLDLFAKFLPNSYDTVRPEGLPLVYCGILSLILLPVYFLSNKIAPRKKIGAGIVLTLLVFTFSASTLDIFWHGLQNPNWLNYRYSFMLCFLMLVLAHEAFYLLKDTKTNYLVAICGILALVIILIQAKGYEYIDDVTCIWISLGAIAAYLLCLYAHKIEKDTSFAAIILAIIVCTECLINGYVSLRALHDDVIFSSRNSYRSYIDKITPAVDYVKQEDTSFYRMEKTTHRRTNDNFTLNMNGITNSTSTLNESIIVLLNRLGYASKSHWSKYLGGTIAQDSLLGLKYIITKKDEKIDSPYYTEIYSDNEHIVYQNTLALSIAFGVSENFKNVDFSSYTNPFDLMNAVVTNMLGKDETVQLFKVVEGVEENTQNLNKSSTNEEYMQYKPIDADQRARITYTFTAGTENELFFFYPSEYPREVALLLNNRDHGTFFGNETDRIVSLGKFDADEDLTITVQLNKDILYLLKNQNYFYSLDTAVLEEVMASLSKDRFNVKEYSNTMLKGDITVSENNNLLFTSIPYDEGWKVYIDGEKVPLIKTADSLLAVEITSGTHELEFKYLPNHFILGNIIAISGFVIFVAVIITDLTIKNKRKKKSAELEQELSECMSALSDIIDSSNEENNDVQSEIITQETESDTTNNTN